MTAPAETPVSLTWLTDLIVDVEDAAFTLQRKADRGEAITPAIATLTRARRRLVRAVAANAGAGE